MVASPVARVNADSDKHILREKLDEFEMVQGIKIADQKVRQIPVPTGPLQRTFICCSGRDSTETRAPTRVNRTDWTVSRLNMRPQRCHKLQATRNGGPALSDNSRCCV
jgi:hypothetical protein